MTLISITTKLRLRTALCPLVFLALLPPLAKAGNGINLSVIQRDGYAVVPIREPAQNILLIHAKINGHPVRLVLDTGALSDGILLDSDFSRVLHLPGESLDLKIFGVSGEISGARKAIGALVELENVQIHDMPLLFAPLAMFRPKSTDGMALTASPGHQFEKADGYIGAGFLHRASAIVDLLNKQLYVRPPGVGRMVDLSAAMKTFQMAEAPLLSTSSGGRVVEVAVDGVRSHMLIDTGAFFTVVDPHYAAQFKEPASKTNIPMIDVAGVEEETDMVTPRSFLVGGNPAIPPATFVTDESFYSASHGALGGLLGVDFLGQNKSILDFGRSKLYFVPRH